MYPFAVDPTPTLTFSMRTLSLTLNGNESAVLNPTDNVIVTSFVEVLNPTELIPTPFEFWIGKMIGLVLLIPNVFFKISTLVLPNSYLRSTSFINLFVFPSKTSSLGAELYPLPKDETPTKSKDARESIFIICGNAALGLTVLSEGKSNPISLIWVFLILPIDLLEASIIAPFPIKELIVEIHGNE